MGAFSAEVSGTTTVLSYWHPEGSDSPDIYLQVRISVDHTIRGAEGLPYWYEYLEQVPDPTLWVVVRPAPLVRIIAAPGVLIEQQLSFVRPALVAVSTGDMDTSELVHSRQRSQPFLEVIRVQDPSLVPRIGDEARLSMLSCMVSINAPSGAEVLRATRSSNEFVVAHEPRAVCFHHLRSRRCLRVEVSGVVSDEGADGVAAPVVSALDSALDLIDPERVVERRRDMRARGRAAVSRARFGYAFEPDGSEGPLLRVVSTRQVRYVLCRSPLAALLMGDTEATRPSAEDVNSFRFEVYPNREFSEIPLPGDPVPRPTDASAYAGVVRPSDEMLEEYHFARDLAIMEAELLISQIPVVGYLYDWGAFAYGVSFGHDFWGRPLSSTEIVLLGIAAVLPVVSGGALAEVRRLETALSGVAPYLWVVGVGMAAYVAVGAGPDAVLPVALAGLFPVGALRRAPRALYALGQRADTVAELVQALRAAIDRGEINGGSREFIERALVLIRAGNDLTPEDLEAVLQLARQILGPEAKLPVQWLLNGNATGFVHPELARLYRASGSRGANPVAWATQLRAGSAARVLIEGLLGAGYESLREGEGLYRHGRRLQNFYYRFVPRPVALVAERVSDAMAVLDRHSDRALDRLGSVVEQLGGLGTGGFSWALWRVGRGHFAILKGNIAEILSLAIQARILRAYQRRFPDACLVSGVMIRMPGGERDLLFSDNLIVRFIDGNIEVLGVMEVKAGAMGGHEATRQIFSWSSRLDSGAEIVLPAGTRVYAGVDDATRELSSMTELAAERRFVHGASSGAVATIAGDAPAIALDIADDSVVGNRVVNLSGARRHIITSAGASGQGMDSVRDVETIFERFELPFSSRELDYLAAEFLARLAALAH